MPHIYIYSCIACSTNRCRPPATAESYVKKRAAAAMMPECIFFPAKKRFLSLSMQTGQPLSRPSLHTPSAAKKKTYRYFIAADSATAFSVRLHAGIFRSRPNSRTESSKSSQTREQNRSVPFRAALTFPTMNRILSIT